MTRADIERECAELITAYIRREIGRLMHQAEHWAAEGYPLAVHHRLRTAQAYFQIEVLFDPARQALGYAPGFDQIREALARPEIKPPGAFPASAELHRYYDPAFVAALPAMPERGGQ